MPGVRLHATNPIYWSGEGATINLVVETPEPIVVVQKFTPSGAPSTTGRDRSQAPCQACSEFDAYGRPTKIVTHARKAQHLRFDSRGDTIVAPEVYAKLLTVPGLIGPGMAIELVGEVKDPPPLKIGAVDKAKERIIALPLNGDAPASKIQPAQSKYEGEKRILAPFVPVMDAERERLDRIETKKRSEKRKLFVPKKKKG